MSKLGKSPISVKEVEAKLEENIFKVKGPKGELSLELPHNISVEIDDKNKMLKVLSQGNSTRSKQLHGTFRSLIANAVIGVSEGFKKKLVFKGVGYRAEVNGKKLILNIGYSHPVEFDIGEGVEIKIDSDKIDVFGIDKQLVGETAAKIREIKIADSYKGHGLHYADEKLKLKPGKTAAKGAEESK